MKSLFPECPSQWLAGWLAVGREGSPCLTVSLSHSQSPAAAAAKRFVRSKATMECCEPVQSKPFLTYFLLPPPLSICLDWKSSDCLMEALTNSPLTNTVRRIARGCASFVIRRLSSSFVVCCLLVADDLNLFVCLFACLLACLVREGVPKALVARFVGFVRSSVACCSVSFLVSDEYCCFCTDGYWFPARVTELH